MRKIHYKIGLACLVAAFAVAACTDADEADVKDKPQVVYPEIRVGVSEMTMKTVSRAIRPMDPDEEKYVRTLAIFEFDTEGMHEKGSHTYHFIDFQKGTVDDVTGVGDVEPAEFGVVEANLKGIALNACDSGTLCLVANITEDQVDEFYEKYREPDQSYGCMTFNNFMKWALPFKYIKPDPSVYDESKTGHIETMYFFGYYQGKIDPATSATIPVDLGRLASRLDITIVNETDAPLDKRFGYHFDNVCDSAYFFPIKSRLPQMSPTGRSRTVVCTGTGDWLNDWNGNGEAVKTYVPPTLEVGEKFAHTRYFYVAAHSAKDASEATRLHLIYNHAILGNDVLGDEAIHVQIPMCNVHPSQADDVVNGYSLSRNTRYHFTIRLKNRDQATAQSRAVEYGEEPGDIVVYLP